jgi:hypothetical protein
MLQRTAPSDALAQWFTYLRGFQSACSFNTSVPQMNLLTFANKKISIVLPTANEQGEFLIAVSQSPGFDISPTVLAACDTFEALLDKFSPLPTYVGVCLQTQAIAPYPSGSAADFFKANASAAFPGGSTGTQWKTAVGLLASVMPAVCFTTAFQAKAAVLLDKAGTKMSDVASQIAGLG